MRWVVYVFLFLLLASGVWYFARGPTIRAEPINVYEKWDLEVIPTCVEYHIVKRGETLDDIASLYDMGNREMTKDMIRELNSLWGINPRPGQALKVPEPNREEWPVGMKWCWGEAKQ